MTRRIAVLAILLLANPLNGCDGCGDDRDHAPPDTGSRPDAGRDGSAGEAQSDASIGGGGGADFDDARVPDYQMDGSFPGVCAQDMPWNCAPAVEENDAGIGDLSVSDVPRPVCPETLPVPETPCSLGATTCGYGDRARSDCRKVFACRSQQWTDVSPRCFQTPKDFCPAERPDPEDGCEVTHFAVTATVPQCEYGDNVTCNCGGTYPGDRGPFWSCNEPPADPNCPDVAPNWGEGCNTQGIECTYGPACQPGSGHWFCRNGAWEFTSFVAECYEE